MENTNTAINSDAIQRYVEKIQDDRPCPQCEGNDYTVTDCQIGETITLIEATCGACGWKQDGYVTNKAILELHPPNVFAIA